MEGRSGCGMTLPELQRRPSCGLRPWFRMMIGERLTRQTHRFGRAYTNSCSPKPVRARTSTARESCVVLEGNLSSVLRQLRQSTHACQGAGDRQALPDVLSHHGLLREHYPQSASDRLVTKDIFRTRQVVVCCRLFFSHFNLKTRHHFTRSSHIVRDVSPFLQAAIFPHPPHRSG